MDFCVFEDFWVYEGFDVSDFFDFDDEMLCQSVYVDYFEVMENGVSGVLVVWFDGFFGVLMGV